MNTDREKDRNLYCSHLVMTGINGGEACWQREMATRHGIAFGLTASHPKSQVAKHYLRGKVKRCTYLPSRNGIIEKSRLAYQHLTRFNNLYKITPQDCFAQSCTLH